MSAICTRIEQYKAKCGLKIAEYNSKIAQINMDQEVTTTSQIGFQYTPTEEDDEEEYDD